MQVTTMPDINELEKSAPEIITKTETSDTHQPDSSAELTTAPQKQLDELESETLKQSK